MASSTPTRASFAASLSKKYRADFESRNTGSHAAQKRSPTDDGIGAGLCQTILSRTHQPSACRASTRRSGIIIRSLALIPAPNRPIPPVRAIFG